MGILFEVLFVSCFLRNFQRRDLANARLNFGGSPTRKKHDKNYVIISRSLQAAFPDTFYAIFRPELRSSLRIIKEPYNGRARSRQTIAEKLLKYFNYLISIFGCATDRREERKVFRKNVCDNWQTVTLLRFHTCENVKYRTRNYCFPEKTIIIFSRARCVIRSEQVVSV